MLKCKELYLQAYGKLYANQGALTPGTDPEDTVDGMSLKRIDAIIERLDKGCYEWKPSRRTYIGKKRSHKKRPLGMPTWSDKLLQEVMRMILEAYYEPQFRGSSHGFRPNRGCHTALKDINRTWTGTKWFIETDIKGCFDNINHDILLEIMGRKIKDERFLKLIREMLKAGYMEQGMRYNTYSGTPQGGIISPLLANIVLNEIDTYVEDTLVPEFNEGNEGKRRRKNPEYVRLEKIQAKARRHKQKWIWNKAAKRKMKIPSYIPDDPEFKRLRYVRYADDSLLGMVGSKQDAETVKQKLGKYIEGIGLEMSEEKTLITHAGKEKARFLNYYISVNWDNTHITKCQSGIRRRSINGSIVLEMPSDVYNEWKAKVIKGDKTKRRPELLHLSDYDIVSTFETELQGLINYYIMAHNVVVKGNNLRFFWQKSLVVTLAGKHKTSAAKIYRKYHYKAKNRNTVAVTIHRKGKKPLVAVFARKPIERNLNVVIDDEVKQIHSGRVQLVDRLLANTCEICGSQVDVEVHHLKKLKDLQKKWQGRKEKPEWVKRMIAIRRKTLVVCQKCHNDIHGGNYDGKKL